MEDCVGMEISGLGNYLISKDEEFLMWMKNFEKQKKKENEPKKKKVHQKHESSYEYKTMHGQFKRGTDRIRGDTTWDWLKKGYLKK